MYHHVGPLGSIRGFAAFSCLTTGLASEGLSVWMQRHPPSKGFRPLRHGSPRPLTATWPRLPSDTLHDHNSDITDESSNADEYERVDDVEISPGDVYANLTRETNSQFVLVTAVGDITELAPESVAEHPEDARRVEHDPEAVVFKTDSSGLETPVTMDARSFRRKVFEDRFYAIRQPERAAYLLAQSRHADPDRETTPGELADEIGGER